MSIDGRHLPPTAGILIAAVGLFAPSGIADAGQRTDQPSGSRARARANPEVIAVARASSKIEVDGRLGESAWAAAPVIEVPYESSPGENTPAPVDTECRITYDAERLYLGCTAFDPQPERIRAHLADRDSPFDDDWIGFILDTFNDQRRAFDFRVNPLGVQIDGLYGQSGGRRNDGFSWDAIWDSEGQITDDGYVVELAIPFKSLSFPETAGPQTWGIIVQRSYPRTVEHDLRSIRTDYDDSCLLCQADRISGFTQLESGADLEFDPTLTTTRTDARDSLPAPDLSTGDLEVEPGLTLHWGVTSNLSLDATLNPDFSQVEADAARLETNRRFALRFEEKRPFFLESADVFDTPEDLVFTRTVLDPVGGAKFTGKIGSNALGLFVTRDRVNSLIFPGSQGSDQTVGAGDVTGAVGRYRRDVGESSTIGVLVTDREGADYHNRVAGVDGRLRLTGRASLSFQYAHSDTRYPDAIARAFQQPTGSFAGALAMARAEYETRNWDLSTVYEKTTTDFRADAGFVPRVGLEGGRARVERSFWSEGQPWFTRFSFTADGEYFEDESGRVNSRSAELSANYSGPLQSFVDLEFTWEDERVGDRLFSIAQQDIFLRVTPSGALEFRFRGAIGEDIDFSNARKADLLRLSPNLTWRLGRHINLNFEHDFERLSHQGQRIFDVNLTELRLRYHFSTEAFLRAIVQYRNLSRNPELYAEPVERREEEIFTQLLFSYKLDPRTVFFLGYTDNREGMGRIDLTQTDRTFFMKLGYAWRP